MKRIRKIISAGIVAMMVTASMSIVASAEASYDITFRVEGPDSNICYETISVPCEDKLTAAEALMYFDEKSDKVKFTGADTGYISAVNDISAGKFGGWDGWYYAVNNEPASVGITDFVLSDNDNLVIYYGGYPCQIPVADTSKLDSEGIILFTSNDTEYDENFNATQVVNKVTDMEVTVNGDKYTTDKNGEIQIPTEKLTSELSVQVEKKDATGAPAVLRFAPDYKVTYNGTINSDTDTDTASDTDTTSDIDSDSDTDTSSNQDISSKTTQNITNSTTTSKLPQSTIASYENAMQTGDGRIYFAVAIFAVALVLVILMFVLKKKSDK